MNHLLKTISFFSIFVHFGLFAEWSSPIQVANSPFAKDPCIDMDAQGKAFVAYSTSLDGKSYNVQLSQIVHGTSSKWASLPTTSNAFSPYIKLDQKGDGLITWNQASTNPIIYECMGGFFSSNGPPHIEILSDPSIATVDALDCPRVSTTSFGNGFVLWYQKALHRSISGGLQHSIQANELVNGVWQEPRTLHQRSYPLSNPFLVENSGRIVGVWIDTGSGKLNTVCYGRGNMITGQIPSSKPSLPISAAMNASGDTVIVWKDEGGVMAIRCTGGVTGVPVLISDPSLGSPTSLSTAIDAEGNVFVIWTQEKPKDHQSFLLFCQCKNGNWGQRQLLRRSVIEGVTFSNAQIAANEEGKVLGMWQYNEKEGENCLFVSPFTEGKWGITEKICSTKRPLFTPCMTLKGFNAAIAWSQGNAIKAVIGFNIFGPQPPVDLIGERIMDTYINQSIYINQLKWKASPDLSVVSYNLYRNGQKIASIPANKPLTYRDSKRQRNKKDIYEIKAVNSMEIESKALTLTLP